MSSISLIKSHLQIEKTVSKGRTKSLLIVDKGFNNSGQTVIGLHDGHGQDENIYFGGKTCKTYSFHVQRT